jgi:protein-L-isoaspartate(D-aspartate) O-methyltransferase
MEMDKEQARFNMIEQQIRPAGFCDPAVLETLVSVQREQFVPATLQGLAFSEIEVPLAEGQTMLTPVQESKILQALKLRRNEKVLHIGTGSGYLAALMGACAAQVVTLEINPRLAEAARVTLHRLGIDNVRVETADGRDGWLQQAPYDVLVASGSVEAIPAAWYEQVRVGGRIFAFVGKGPVMKAQIVMHRIDGQFSAQTVFETAVPKLVGMALAGFQL